MGAGVNAAESAPEPSERGRYAVHTLPDGGLLVARSGPRCEKCAACGCGEQRDPIGPISGALVKLAAAAAGEMTMAGALKRMIRL